MKRLILLLGVLSCSLVQNYLNAQEKVDIKFGKISPSDFDWPANAIGKDDAAVYIADIGFTEFRGNTKGWFSLHFERKARIRINNANGLDAADFRIYLSKDGNAVEKLINLKASSYNLENGEVIETKLKPDQVFSDKYSKNLDLKKFSVPGTKAGSLVEVSYIIESDFIRNLQPWEFQGQYPRLWSEYEVGFPEFFSYVTLAQGYHPLHLKKSKEERQQYRVMLGNGAERSEIIPIEGSVDYIRWVMKDVPALKEEAFTSSIDNHISKLEFQLSQYKFPDQVPQNVMSQWPEVTKSLNESEFFGSALYRNNGWLDDELKPVVAGLTGKTNKAKKIYAYLRDKYTCTVNRGQYLTSNLKDVVKAKSGNVADINLLLVAMLNHEDIKSFPVILSTRSNGLTHEFYPLMDRFNYVVAQADIDGKPIYLDATEPGLPFGVLPLQCYNGQARVINDFGTPVYFMPDSVTEKKVTTLFMSKDSAGVWRGNYTSQLGQYESVSVRSTIKEKGEDGFKESLKKGLPAEFALTNVVFENKQDTGLPVQIKYELALESDDDMLYLNPLLGEGYKENPFKSETRLYPVEMPYTMNEMYVCNIDVPEGYEVDEMPKSAKVGLFDDDGFFEYIIGKSGSMISFRSRLVIKRADFSAEDYESLREFFGYVVKKQSESIVLKKKS